MQNRWGGRVSGQPGWKGGVRKTNGGQDQQTGAAGKGRHRSTGAGAVQTVQARLVGNCGTHSQRARHALCLPVLPQVASRARSGARLQENAAGAVGALAQGGGVTKKEWNATGKNDRL